MSSMKLSKTTEPVSLASRRASAPGRSQQCRQKRSIGFPIQTEAHIVLVILVAEVCER